MKHTFRFILIELFKTLLPIFFLAIFYFSIGVKDFLSRGFIPLYIIIAINIGVVLYNLYRLRRLGIDMTNAQNLTGSITHNMQVPLTSEEINKLIKQDNWKFKLKTESEQAGVSQLVLSHGTSANYQKIEIAISNNNAGSNITLTTSYYSKLFFWLAKTSFWGLAVRNIDYFQEMLDKRINAS